MSLAVSALEAIPVLTETTDTGFAWTIFTGDLIAHDPDNEASRFVAKPSMPGDKLDDIATGHMLSMLRYLRPGLSNFAALP